MATYRPDIDGLRAVAVLGVILYHFEVWPFSGGFVGVDVFFVISGYLITGIIANDLQADRFSILTFYQRRVRRILPALVACVAATSVAGLFILLPNELQDLGQSLIATALFASNIYFWSQSGYFAPAADTQPLLHTWSLAVEEQFYIAFPLILAAVWRWNRRALVPTLLVLALLSLGVSAYQVQQAPQAAFYLSIGRGWELLVGSLIALCRSHLDKVPATCAWLGLAAIVASLVGYNEQMPFPGLAALLPCLGAAAIIVSAPGTMVGNFLSSSPMRGIGLISYSLYLWHWPILAYMRLITDGRLPPGWQIVGFVLAFLAAYASWRYIERPFRQRTTSAPSRTLIAGAAALVSLAAIGLTCMTGLPSRVPDDVRALAEVATSPRHKTPGCWATARATDIAADCLAPHTDAKKVVAWGDSHANQYAAAIEKIARNSGREMRMITLGGCAPLLDAVPIIGNRRDERCLRFNTAVMTAIVRDPTVDVVVLGGRWARYTFDKEDPEYRGLALIGTAEQGNAQSAVISALRLTIEKLRSAGKRVILVGIGPEFVSPLPSCLARAVWFRSDQSACALRPETVPPKCGLSWFAHYARAQTEAYFIDPQAILCSLGTCSPSNADGPILRDEDHLSEATATAVLEKGGLGQTLTAEMPIK